MAVGQGWWLAIPEELLLLWPETLRAGGLDVRVREGPFEVPGFSSHQYEAGEVVRGSIRIKITVSALEANEFILVLMASGAAETRVGELDLARTVAALLINAGAEVIPGNDGNDLFP